MSAADSKIEFSQVLSKACGRKTVLAGSVVAMFGVLGSTSAMAQNCNAPNFFGISGSLGSSLAPASAGLAGANVIAGSIIAANTAFLTQSTAFVSAPPNPRADSEGGGIWTRGVGGMLNLNTAQTATAQVVGFPFTGSATCTTSSRQSFGGVQIGQDIAKLNVNGWNLHFGTTAGYLETNGTLPNGNLEGGLFNSTTQAPFVGTYAVATNGGFFADASVRGDYFQTTLNSPSINLYSQSVDARGISVTASAGYKWDVPNSDWFYEPSVGVIWSRDSVDPLNTASPAFGMEFGGTTRIDDLQSLIGRLGLRVGTTITINKLVLQPFASASVWHDFDGNYSLNYTACAHCFGFGSPSNFVPATYTVTATTQNVGTFGQYSLGVSGQVIDTGWLGFVRVDYRDGDRMNGLSATGGVRYQFTPTSGPTMPVVMPVKAKAKVKAPVLAEAPIDWTGWYVGVIGGANYGRSDVVFPGVADSAMRPAGPFGGGEIGFNQQYGQWVEGFEADISSTSARASAQCAPLTPRTNAAGTTVMTQLFQMTCHDDLNWVATATARLGLLWNSRTLLYIKGGGAWASESFSMTCNLGPIIGFNGSQTCFNPAFARVPQASASDTRFGWTVGFGSEFALTQRWFAKAEFDWLDFGRKTLTMNDGTVISATQRVAQGKVGLNFKY
jgi:outer membrane autotransporter protein